MYLVTVKSKEVEQRLLPAFLVEPIINQANETKKSVARYSKGQVEVRHNNLWFFAKLSNGNDTSRNI